MTGKRQRGRILLMAEGIKLAKAFKKDGILDVVAKLLELESTSALTLDQEVILAYAIAAEENFHFQGDYLDP